MGKLTFKRCPSRLCTCVCGEPFVFSKKNFILFFFWHNTDNIVTIFSTGSSACSSVSLDARVVHKCLIRFESRCWKKKNKKTERFAGLHGVEWRRSPATFSWKKILVLLWSERHSFFFLLYLKNIYIFLLLLIIFFKKRNVLTSTYRLLDMCVCVCVCSIVYTYI